MRLEIRTQRLTLRPPAPADEAAVVAALNDIAVTGWLAVVPHPYFPADYHSFVNDYAVPGETYMIHDPDGVCGIMGIEEGTLGYWLAPSCQGKGYATEAGRQLLAEWFSLSDTPVVSGYFSGNSRSAHVLRKLGFLETGRGPKPCRAMKCDRDHVDMVLTRAAFDAALPIAASSKRLTYRPMVPSDLQAVQDIVRHWDVTRQLGPKWPWPADPDFTVTRLRGFHGDGFAWAVVRDGAVIGTVAVTDGSLGYLLHPDHQGQGLMTEACRTALGHAFDNAEMAMISAGVWADNPASLAVLDKLGFKMTGETTGTSIARPLPSRGFDLILTRADWRSA